MCHLFFPRYLLTLEALEMLLYFPSHIVQMNKSNILPLGIKWLSGPLEPGWLLLESESLLLSMSNSLRHHGQQPARLLCPWDFPGRSGLPFPSPGYLLHPGIKPGSPALQVGSEPPRKTSYSLEELIVTIIFFRKLLFLFCAMRIIASSEFSLQSVNTVWTFQLFILFWTFWHSENKILKISKHGTVSM